MLRLRPRKGPGRGQRPSGLSPLTWLKRPQMFARGWWMEAMTRWPASASTRMACITPSAAAASRPLPWHSKACHVGRGRRGGRGEGEGRKGGGAGGEERCLVCVCVGGEEGVRGHGIVVLATYPAKQSAGRRQRRQRGRQRCCPSPPPSCWPAQHPATPHHTAHRRTEHFSRRRTAHSTQHGVCNPSIRWAHGHVPLHHP